MDYRVMFLRSEQGRPVGCLAIKLNRKARTLEYGVSVLNPADKFDRKVARQLAIGRMTETPTTIGPVLYDLSMHEISRVVMLTISMDRTMPTRAVKAARLWLSTNKM